LLAVTPGQHPEAAVEPAAGTTLPLLRLNQVIAKLGEPTTNVDAPAAEGFRRGSFCGSSLEPQSNLHFVISVSQRYYRLSVILFHHFVSHVGFEGVA
jgi:hypothetical protein